MGRESYAFYTGLFVLILGSALLALVVWLGGYDRQFEVYNVTTRSAVSGLKPASIVYYRGIEVGKVTTIDLDPADAATIRVRIELTPGLPITTRTRARLRLQPLTGLAQIELDGDGSGEPLRNQAEQPATIPMQPSLLDHLALSGQDLLGQTGELINNLNAVLNADNRAHLEHILAQLDSASAQLIPLTQRLDRALQNLPALENDAQQALQHWSAVSNDARAALLTLNALSGETRQLAGDGRALLPTLNRTLETLQAGALHVQQLSRALAQDPPAVWRGAAPTAPGPGEVGYEANR